MVAESRRPKNKRREPDIRFIEGKGQTFHAQLPWKLQDQAWATQHTLAVYAAVRRYTNWGGIDGAFPSIPRIVEKSHVSRSQVFRELKKLRQHRWIEWVSGKNGETNTYRVHLDPDAPDQCLPDTGQCLPDTGVVPTRHQGQCLPDTQPIHSTTNTQLPSLSTTTSSSDDTRSQDPEADHPLALQEDFLRGVFAQCFSLYPKRLGGNSKTAAWKAWYKRIRTGATTDDLRAGTERYAAFIRSTGKEGTPYVKQAATFYGPNKHYLEPWTTSARSSPALVAKDKLAYGRRL